MRFSTDLPDPMIEKIDARLTRRDRRGLIGRNEEIAKLLSDRLDRPAVLLMRHVDEVDARAEENDHSDPFQPRSAVVDTMLDRYLGVLKRGRRQLRGRLSRDELLVVAAACCGWTSRQEPGEMLVSGLLSGDTPMTVLAAQVQDHLHYEGDGGLDVDGPALVEGLNSLTTEETLALLDVVEMWWAHEDRPDAPEV